MTRAIHGMRDINVQCMGLKAIRDGPLEKLWGGGGEGNP